MSANKQISLMDFVILQFFYAFQNVYESLTSILKWSFWKNQPKTENKSDSVPSPMEKRHFIELYSTETPGKKPKCFINVIEFDSSTQEEEIRNRKRSYDFTKVPLRRTHQRTRSCELERYYCSNLRY